MKKSITALFLFISFFTFSQDIKLKKGKILIENKEWLNYDGCGSFNNNCNLMLISNNEEVVYMNWVKVPNAEPISNYNRTGELAYIQIKFLGLNASIEMKQTFKKAISIIYNSKAVNEDGSFDKDKVMRLVEKYGTPFSDQLNNTNNNTTIIIKEEPSKPGVNINIGR